MEIPVKAIDCAVDQLDWAIRLFLDYQAYVPAITLAGAAEEILGKRLDNDNSSLHEIKNGLAIKYELDEKEIDLNEVKNFLKHGKVKGKNIDSLDIALKNWAMIMINRGLTNLYKFDESLPSEGLRYLKYIQEESYLKSAK